ncbi:MAG: hypothetical protein IPI58_03240 [Alphaproteobacteria bacterium]|nr:MAG: hypothetical protein IPI58_03240 [Alphaproteobacteria bacterium]
MDSKTPNPSPPGDVLFELTRIGDIVKVTAVDVHTGTEVSLQGPTSAGEILLRQRALQKLRYVMQKRKGD